MQSIEECLGCKIVQYYGWHFLSAEKSLEGIGRLDVGRCLQENFGYINGNLKSSKFPELNNRKRGNICFFDIETRGFKPEIITISTLSMANTADGYGKIKLECTFARDPSEEKPMLKYFVDNLREYQTLFSYNGNSFDICRLTKRIESLGLTPKNGGHMTFSQIIKLMHDDLYPKTRASYPSLPDHKLQTVEKLILGYSRENDLKSSQIEKIYADFVRGKSNYTDITRLIMHNLADVASLPAILIHISKH